MYCRLTQQERQAIWKALHDVSQPQQTGRRVARRYPPIPGNQWFKRHVRKGQHMRIDGRALTCGRRGVWVQTHADLNKYVQAPTDQAVVCLVRLFIQVVYNRRRYDLAMVTASRYAGGNDSGTAPNTVRTLWVVDVGLKCNNVTVLPMEALRDLVFLAPCPAKYASNKRMRIRIQNEHNDGLHYVLAVDDI